MSMSELRQRLGREPGEAQEPEEKVWSGPGAAGNGESAAGLRRAGSAACAPRASGGGTPGSACSRRGPGRAGEGWFGGLRPAPCCAVPECVPCDARSQQNFGSLVALARCAFPKNSREEEIRLFPCSIPPVPNPSAVGCMELGHQWVTASPLSSLLVCPPGV